jgi:uncharacterized protein (TIGR03067 family)
MRSLIIVLACCLIAADAPAPPDDSSKDDLEALQGVWEVVLMETSGKILPDNKVHGMTATFKADKLSLLLDGKKRDFSFQLDGAKSPKQVNLTGKAGKQGTLSVTWLYTLAGDDLRFCGDMNGGSTPPPTEMRTKAKDKYSLVVFKRKKSKESK